MTRFGKERLETTQSGHLIKRHNIIKSRLSIIKAKRRSLLNNVKTEMTTTDNTSKLNIAVKKLSRIPSIGPKVGMMLAEIGINEITDLVKEDPEKLYQKVCDNRGEVLDRCVLYHFRCAVYFASNDVHEPDRLKWWFWKDNT